MMWYWGSGAHWWAWLVGTIGMVAFWALVIWAIWYVVTSLPRGTHGPPPPSSRNAKDILDERLARGEIDVAEYERLRDVIVGRTAPTRNGRRSVDTPVR